MTEALATEAYPFSSNHGSNTPLWLRIEKNAFKHFPGGMEHICLVSPSMAKRRQISPFTAKAGVKIHVLCD